MSKIFVVGIGPGNKENMTLKAMDAIHKSHVIIGYTQYIKLIENEFPEKKLISSPMKKEVQRCELAVETAQKSNCTVCLISSGDSGIYGMASILLETLHRLKSTAAVEIIPGITSACASAALLGAPISHDFAVISLSDLLTPWTLIEKRIQMAAEGDFVVCFYNPRSKNRKNYIIYARELLLLHRKKETPVGIVKNAGRKEESVMLCTLENLQEYFEEIDMFSTVIVGNSQSYISKGHMITPRGYPV